MTEWGEGHNDHAAPTRFSLSVQVWANEHCGAAAAAAGDIRALALQTREQLLADEQEYLQKATQEPVALNAATAWAPVDGAASVSAGSASRPSSR